MASSPYFMGIDGGTESVRVGIFDREGTPVGFASHAYTLKCPRPGWAEQDPDEWWSSLVAAVKEVMSKSGIAPNEIAGLSLDSTTCTVVALDKYDRVLRPAIIWMDIRAADQARRVAKTRDAALKYNGFAQVSAEWMPCKALWLKENEPDMYRAATHICEYTDWMTHRLTGEWTASINIASLRWYYDRNNGGFPASLYQAVELDDLLEKFPQKILDMGTTVGGLSKKAAEEWSAPLPTILDHEMAGHVYQVGRQVRGYEVGAPVAMAPVITCQRCFYCQNGMENICPHQKIVGYDVKGGLSEYVRIPADAVAVGNLFVAQNDLPSEYLALTEPLAASMATSVLRYA